MIFRAAAVMSVWMIFRTCTCAMAGSSAASASRASMARASGCALLASDVRYASKLQLAQERDQATAEVTEGAVTFWQKP